MFSNWPIIITRSWYRRGHLNLEVLKVLVCRVTLSVAATHGVAFTFLLVSLRRNAMSCPVTSRPTKPHQGHVSQGAAKTWWRVASKQVPVASAPSATQNSINPIRI